MLLFVKNLLHILFPFFYRKKTSRIVDNAKRAAEFADGLVVNSFCSMPDVLNDCPVCHSKLYHERHWKWFVCGYDSNRFSIPLCENPERILRSSSMHSLVLAVCDSCGKRIECKDSNCEITKYDHRAVLGSLGVEKL